ncbi:hypothetical protein DB346_01375 [Verrucomicrobia bacterium LW23]|nr:hypothetical protein DB346_01375 [Verrucomicrobia bacterium LW23]
MNAMGAMDVQKLLLCGPWAGRGRPRSSGSRPAVAIAATALSLFCALSLALALCTTAAHAQQATAIEGQREAGEGAGPGGGAGQRKFVRPRLPQGNYSATITVTDKMEAARVEEVTRKGGKPGPTRRPVIQTLTIRRLGGKTLYRIAWQTGASTEVWHDDSGLLVEEAADGSIKVPRGDSGPLLPELASLRESSISWIRPQRDREEATTLNGRPCLHFSRDMRAALGIEAEYQAWIDTATGYPIQLDDGTATYRIEYDPIPPTGHLVIPAKFQKELDRIAKELRAPSYL